MYLREADKQKQGEIFSSFFMTFFFLGHCVFKFTVRNCHVVLVTF